MQGIHLRKYGVGATIDFELYEIDGVDLRTDAVSATGDVTLIRDGGGGSVLDADTFTDEGQSYSLDLSVAEMTAASIVVYVVDQGTKIWLDRVIFVETYGHASAQHAFDLDTPSVAQGADNNTILSSLTIANGAVDSKITYIMDTILTEGAGGRLAAAIVKLFDVVTPVLVASDVMVGTDNAAIAGDSMDMSSISGDSTAADNLELQYDGTGIIGDTYPFTQAAGAALGGGLSILTTMASATAILGDSNNLANASTSDDSRWTADDNGSGAETIFRCTPTDTSHIPVEVTFEGYYDKSGGPGATLQVYNFNTVGWDTIVTFTNAGADEDHETPLSHAHKAPTNGTLETVAYTLGDVMIKFKQDSTAAGDNVLLIDYMVVGFVGSLVTAADVVDEWESQSQADPTGFHVNEMEVNGTPQTANDNSADINDILADTNELQADDIPTSIAALPTAVEIQAEMEQDGASLLDTIRDQIGTAGAGLTNINLPNQTMDIIGNITGNLSGSVGSLTGHTNQTANHTANISTLLTRLSAARAGYLDELNVATSGKMAWYQKKAFIALVNKVIFTEANGGAEQFNDAGGSIGSIPTAVTSDGDFTIKKRMVF